MSIEKINETDWIRKDNTYTPAEGGYIRVYRGEFRGRPGSEPLSDIKKVCSLACDSAPGCNRWLLEPHDPTGTCILLTGSENRTYTERLIQGHTTYVRDPSKPRPDPKYKTKPIGVTLSTIGGHYCQGDGWSADGEGLEVQNSGGNRYCVENYPKPTRCPSDLGPAIIARLANSSGTEFTSSNYGLGQNSTYTVCRYNTIPDAIIWNPSKMNAYFDGSDVTGTQQAIKIDFLAPKTYTDLAGNATYQGFYTAQGAGRLNSEFLARILREKPTTWPDDPAMLSKMLDIMVSQTAAATDAKDMMARYCSITNPQWADNDPMRTFVNELIKPGDPAKTNPALQATATDLAMQYCLANPTSLHCGCWNAAVNKGYNGCSLDANKDLPGCRGLYDLKQTFKQAPASMASVITPIENAIKPGCFAAECKSSKASSADVNLRTSDITNCTDTINICLQSVTVGGDMRGTLNQACNINVEGGGANTGGLPTSLQQTLSGGNVVTSTDGLTRTVDGVSVDVAALIIKPGKSVFVDKYLPTPQKQKMAIGGVVAIVVLCFCLIVLAVVASSSGGEKGSSDIGAILAMQARQKAAAAAASQNAMRAQLSGLKKLAAS